MIKILWLLIFSLFLFATDLVIAEPIGQLFTKSTTYILQTANIPQSSYDIGMGVGKLPPYGIKVWKINTAPELAYLLSGQVTISIKNHDKKTTTAGYSYKPPVNILHQIQAGPEGMTYIVVWGQKNGNPITKNRIQGTLKEIDLPLISQIAKCSTNLVNISSKLDVLETGHIPQSPYDITLAKGFLTPNIIKPWHKYYYPEIFYILNGEIMLTLKNHPAKKYIFGDSFKILPNVFSQIKTGPAGVAYLVIWVHTKV